MKKRTIALLSLFGGLSLSLGGGLASSAIAYAEEEETLENGPVETVQVDYDGKDVNLTVEYADGKYYLADYTRNIFVHDGTSVRTIDEMHTNPNKFPIYTCTQGKFKDPMAVSIFHNIVQAYDYYTEANIGFDWKGVNGKNDDVHNNYSARRGVEYPIHVFVHMNVGEYRYNAAYSHMWNASHCIIFIGDGSDRNNAANMKHQGAALDVLVHEYQHGVTEFYSKGLSNQGDPGALNEAFSDMIALIAEGKAKGYDPEEDRFWLIGEDAVSQYGKYIRDIAHPSGGFRGSYAERYIGGQDYGGVHWNSTIVTHMQYLACKNLPGFFNYDNLAKLWLETLKTISPNASFVDFVKDFRAAASNLGFPEEAQEAIAKAAKDTGFDDYYRVLFKNPDGTIAGTSYVSKGETATAPKSPKMEHTDKVRYVFDKWEGDYSNIQEDTVIMASYKEISIFVVRFLDGQGEVFSEQVVDVGKRATKPSGVPLKEATDGKKYIFDHWDYDFGEVTESVDVLPVFNTINVYKVRFLNGDGTVLSEQNIDEGGKAVAPKEIPVKEQDSQNRYIFREWENTFREVHSDLDVNPLFDVIHIYTVQFVDSEGNPLSEEYTVDEGESVEAPEAPRKASDEQYTYTFSGWDGNYENIRESAVISPLYDKKIRTYTVAYYIDGKISDPVYADYGTALDTPPEGYDGWYSDPDCTRPYAETTVTGHLKLYAKKLPSHTGLYVGLGIGGGVLVIAAVATVLAVKSKKRKQEELSDSEEG